MNDIQRDPCPWCSGEMKGGVCDYCDTPESRGVEADCLTALQALGIEPPEFPGESWSILLSENGPEEGATTALATARMYLAAQDKTLAAERALSDALAGVLRELDPTMDGARWNRVNAALAKHAAARKED